MKSVVVFTGKNCAKCDSLKARLKDRGFLPKDENEVGDYTVLDVMTNMSLAKLYGVRSVPTTVVLDPETEKEVAFYTSDNKIDEIVAHLSGKL